MSHREHPVADDSAVDTFGEILLRLRALIPRSLLDGPGWEHLRERVGGLPADKTTVCGFEYRLDEPAPAADFFFGVTRGEPLERHLVRQGEAARPDSAEAALARHLVLAGRSDFPLSDWHGKTMLEYDIVEVGSDARPAPGVFLGLLREPRPERRRPALLPPGRIVAATVANAVGWTEDESERRAVERVFAAFPPGGRVAHAGAMPSRKPRAIRLVPESIAAREIGSFLKRLEWPGRIRTIAAILDEMRDVFTSSRISFDVSARGVSPRLGLELYSKGSWRSRRPTTISNWRPIVDRLEAKGWCLPAKARGLLAWPGIEKIYSSNGVFIVYKGISHFKITIEEGVVHAKGYASMWSRPVEALLAA